MSVKTILIRDRLEKPGFHNSIISGNTAMKTIQIYNTTFKNTTILFLGFAWYSQSNIFLELHGTPSPIYIKS